MRCVFAFMCIYYIEFWEQRLVASRKVQEGIQKCKSASPCLFLVNDKDRISIVQSINEQLRRTKKLSNERTQFLTDLVKECVVGISLKGNIKPNWTLGNRRKELCYEGCCRQCFLYYYEFGSTLCVDICNKIKRDEAECAARNFTDKSKRYKYNDWFKDSLESLALRSKINLNHNQIAAMQIPNSHQSLHCFGWMDYYFNLMGCRPPNAKSHELHLEPITMEEVWQEYSDDMKCIEEKYVEYSQFAKLWDACFGKTILEYLLI